jgi:MFS family permease
MSDAQRRRPAALSGRSGLIGLLTANAVSLTGTQISQIALPWYVLNSTGSAVVTGLVSFSSMGPYVLVKMLGGPVIDRLGARRVSVVSDVLSALFCGLIPVLHAAHALPLPLLLVLAALLGAARGPGDAAKVALVPSVAAGGRVSLERVAGLSGTVSRLAGSIGPAAAGALVALVGSLTSVAVDAASFAAAAVLISVTLPRTAPGTAADDGGQEPAQQEGYGRRLRAGFAFLRSERLLLTLTLMAAVTNLLDNGVMTVIIPVWARAHGGPAAMGALTTAVSVTAMGGSLAASAIAERLPRRTTYFVSFLIGGAPRIAILALGAPVWLAVALWAVAGTSLGFVNPILSAVMYERIPEKLLGRVSALSATLSAAGTPLGGLAAGGLIGLAGLAAAASVYAVVYLAATTLPALGATWRDLGRPADDPDRTEPAEPEPEPRPGREAPNAA